MRLAERCNGVLVNADSAQLYRGLSNVSAGPTPADLARVPHLLYGVRDPADPASAADWGVEARLAIESVHAAGQLPILVGGSGLYLRTLLDGIAPVPPIDPAIRAAVRGAEVGDNRRQLEILDPLAAERLGAGDSARVARALEVVLSTGRTIAQWRQSNEGGMAAEVYLAPLILLPPRDWLYRRCDARFEAILAGGAIDEVQALLDRGLAPSLPAMRAIGVREIAALLAGRLNRCEALAAGRQATRNYAKRQYAWFRHQPPAGWPRLAEPLEGEAVETALTLLG